VNPLGRSGGTTRSAVLTDLLDRQNLGVKPHLCGRANSGPNPTAHLAGVGEGSLVLGMPLGSLAHLRHARRGAATVALVAGVVVLTTSTSPAQAFVSPTSGSNAAAPSVAVAKSVAAHTTAAAVKRPVSSAVTVVKARGAKPAPVKKTGLTSALILATARKYDGSYYRHGGSTPAGFDCSGYTRYVFGKLGKSLPHNAAAQAALVHRVSRASARPGDLIFFHSSSGHVYHVGIYAGHGTLYHASEYGVRTGLGTIFSSNVTFGRV
jgi:cell wall-associated NlpC family hydrolase